MSIAKHSPFQQVAAYILLVGSLFVSMPALAAQAKYAGSASIMLNAGPIYRITLNRVNPDGTRTLLVDTKGYWSRDAYGDDSILSLVECGHRVDYLSACENEDVGHLGGVFLGLKAKLWLHAGDMVMFQYDFRDDDTPIIFQAGQCRYQAVDWKGVSGIQVFKFGPGADVIFKDDGGLVWEIQRIKG